MLIRNYGLFWRRNLIFWGAGRKPGHFKGVPSTAMKSDPIDFRQQTGVYALYDEALNLVYVGQAGVRNSNLFSRIKQHRSDRLAERWDRVSWFGTRKVNSTGNNKGKLAPKGERKNVPMSDVLNHIEAILIEVTEPPNNRQGGRFGDKVQQYLQWRDDKNLYPPLEIMVQEIWNQS